MSSACVPQYSDDPAVQMYYEFMHFYPITQNYLLTFTKPGSYARLQKSWAKARMKVERRRPRRGIIPLQLGRKAFGPRRRKLRCTVGDVLLLLLRVYTKEELAKLSPNELSEKLDALWDDVLALQRLTRACQRQTRRAEADRAVGPHSARQAHRTQPLESCLCPRAHPRDQLLDEPARVWTYPVGHRICGPGRDDRLLQRSPR